LKSLCIPKTVELINKPESLLASIESVSVEADNKGFKIEKGFLIGIVENKAIRFFGKLSKVIVMNYLKILGSSFFYQICWRREKLKS
jgi:hypothetical protein